MELATGAMGSLLPKLAELLKGEYNLQASAREDVEALSRELRSIEVALTKVAEVPRDQLDKQVKLWADNVRELSYEMEDIVDGFMVRVDGPADPAVDSKTLKRFRKKIAGFFKKAKTRRQIASKIEEIKVRVKEVADQRDRYKVDDVRANPAAATTVDPRMRSLFKDQRELVGVEGPRDELIKRLSVSSSEQQQLKILSIFGFGGLGKTTLAKAVYDKLQAEFVCRAFISVGQHPSPKKVFMDILYELDRASCSNATMLDERQLIEKLRELLVDKRYLIVIDDIWDIESWETIRCACIDSNCGSIIITTTRVFEVAKETGHVYKHEPLSRDNSKELFYKRLSIGKDKNFYDQSVEISKRILQKCGGVPLAIITLASLLADKPKEDWSEVYSSIGFGDGDNKHVDNTRKILMYSYYDLPYYLKTCLLHLSIYPEDYEILKSIVIWNWVAEGFIHKKSGMGLFELGERYFNELINRSMIQPIEDPFESGVYACRVHDLVLEMIRSLAKEENFVVILDGNEQHTTSHSNARRLAIQKRFADEQQDSNLANTHMRQVRSFNATRCHLSTLPSLSSFQVLRVLALDKCILTGDRPYHLEHLGRLLQLRYLGLLGTYITDQLPEEIGNLRFLQTLDLQYTKISKLPHSVGLLRQLKCLRLSVFSEVLVPDWIGNMSSLEELSNGIHSPDSVKELRKLTELREFRAIFETVDATLFKDLMESIGHLRKLQVLEIRGYGRDVEWAGDGGYVPPRHLRRLDLSFIKFPALPAWIDSSFLPHLAYLRLYVKALKAEDVGILDKFPELIDMALRVDEAVVFPDVVAGGGAFSKLRHLETGLKVRFLPGAMPSLESVIYIADVEAVEACSVEGDFFASLGNLPRLQKVRLFYMGDANFVAMMKAEDGLWRAIEIHPNTPTCEVYDE